MLSIYKQIIYLKENHATRLLTVSPKIINSHDEQEMENFDKLKSDLLNRLNLLHIYYFKVLGCLPIPLKLK